MRLSAAPRWCGGHHPVGDAEAGPIRLSLDPQLRVEFRGATVTSDAGLLLPREATRGSLRQEMATRESSEHFVLKFLRALWATLIAAVMVFGCSPAMDPRYGTQVKFRPE